MYVDSFLRDIEDNIFNTKLIYRTILVVHNSEYGHFIKQNLENNDYGVLMLDEIDKNIDYNNIDVRIVIVIKELFKEFIDFLDKCTGILESSYNFIGFDYEIDEKFSQELVTFYLQKTKNNINNTIIFDKNYVNFLHFEKEVNTLSK